MAEVVEKRTTAMVEKELNLTLDYCNELKKDLESTINLMKTHETENKRLRELVKTQEIENQKLIKDKEAEIKMIEATFKDFLGKMDTEKQELIKEINFLKTSVTKLFNL